MFLGEIEIELYPLDSYECQERVLNLKTSSGKLNESSGKDIGNVIREVMSESEPFERTKKEHPHETTSCNVSLEASLEPLKLKEHPS